MTLAINDSAAHRPSALRVVIAFGTVYLVWGSTYLAIKLVSQHGAFVLAGSRFLCAAILLFAIACWQGAVRRSDFTVKSWSNAAVVGCCLMLIGNGGVAIATNTVDSGVVALMTAITPLWLVGLDRIVHKSHRPTKTVWIGIALGICGIVVLKADMLLPAGLAVTSTAPSSSTTTATTTAPTAATTAAVSTAVSSVGIVTMIVATFGWALGSVWSKRPGGAHSPLVATAMQMLVGGVAMLIASVPKELAFHDEWSLLRSSPPDFITWMQWSYLVVFGSLCGFTAYIWLLRHQPASRVATYAYVNPLVAILVGWIFIGESIGSRTILAAALMLGGVAVIQVSNARKMLFTRAPIAAE